MRCVNPLLCAVRLAHMSSAPEQPPRQFHWINKDSDSVRLSRSQGQEAVSILRFVQQNRPKTRRKQQTLSGRTQHDFVAFETQAKVDVSKLVERETSQDHRQSVTVSNETDVNAFRSLQSKWRIAQVPVNNVISGSGIDPFLSTVIPLDSSMYSVLQFARQKILNGGAGYKLDIFSNRLKPMTDMYEAAVQYVFKEVMVSKHVIFPILSAFSTSLLNAAHSPFVAAVRRDRYLQLASEAVRTALAEHLDDRRILRSIATGVHFLICSAALSGRLDETVIHINAFLKFLPYINTKSLIGHWEVDVVSSWDILNAAARGQTPTLKIRVSDPGAFATARMTVFDEKLAQMKVNGASPSQPRLDIVEYHDRVIRNKFDLLQNPSLDFDLNLGSGLQRAKDTNQLHHVLLPIIHSLFDCVKVAKVVWQAPDFATKQDTSWLCRRTRAVLHELLSLGNSKEIDITTFAGRQGECLRLTLIIILMSALSRVLFHSRREQALRLKAMLIPIARLDWEAQVRGLPQVSSVDQSEDTSPFNPHEMLLWIAMTGYWAAMGSPEAVWFAETAVEIAVQRLDLRGYKDLHTTMNKYLYSRTVQQECLEQIAEMMGI